MTKYLTWKKDIADPAVRLAEQAVEDAAARELAAFRSEDALETLLKIALPHPQPGMVEALGQFACIDAMPYFIRALEDDFCQAAAESALRTLGHRAEMALVNASRTALPSPEEERPSSKRRRMRSLQLLAELGPSAETWRVLRSILTDPDPGIALAISQLAAALGDERDKATAVDRLLEILPTADWFERDQIQDCLVTLYREGQSRIEEELAKRTALPESERVMDPTLRVLLGVHRRANAALVPESDSTTGAQK